MKKQLRLTSNGFTIVELAVVITVLAILVGIVVVGYGAWRDSISVSAIKSDLLAAKSAMENERNFSNGYPVALPSSFDPSDEVTVTYSSGNATSFCLQGRSTKNTALVYKIRQTDKEAQSGTCP